MFAPEIQVRSLYTLVTRGGREIALYYRCPRYRCADRGREWVACVFDQGSANDNGETVSGLPEAILFSMDRDEFDCILATFRNISAKRPNLIDLSLGLHGMLDCIRNGLPVPLWLAETEIGLDAIEVMVTILRRFDNINREYGRYIVRGREPFFTDDIDEAMLHGLRAGSTVIDLISLAG